MVLSRKVSDLALSASSSDRNTKFCSRMWCSGRQSSRGAQVVVSEKLLKGKFSGPSVRFSSNSEEIIGTSKTVAIISSPNKPLVESQKGLTPNLQLNLSDTASVQDEPEIPNPTSHLETGGSEFTPVSSNPRSIKNSRQKIGFTNSVSHVGPSVSPASRSTTSNSFARPNTTTRYGLKNFKCNSTADVVSSATSSSDSSASKKKEMAKKIFFKGESSSSAKGKKITGPSLECRNSISSRGISISDSRHARSWNSNRDTGNPTIRKSLSDYTRARVASGEHRNRSQNESPNLPQLDISIDLDDSNSARECYLETSLSHPSSYDLQHSSSEFMGRVRPGSPAEVGSTRSLVNRESFLRYNMDGIAEVLLALERIEQDEELTYEQFLVLETSLFLNGLNFYDQHRDMRLDIDNMSYEELLDLEERMGTVSTALPEEALSACLQTSIYQSTPITEAITGCSTDNSDVKCSVCQEEYVAGDEVGRLQCEHKYHLTCIEQWLQHKNWCPICKASAAVSSLPST